ncbi:hypothetical protein MKK67_12940 [Methylobacterium sp. J-072]|uniref:hypothetical protein n=1 Tax=Methylobacterium sp. J-072 TaxID=2836651 RepID=UPI001FBA13D6|nr:hypothetical protein [Methylobacterium sp. J-072]MCJ2093385.1 hypothetical protein [Methylobacterium sp. J-072]
MMYGEVGRLADEAMWLSIRQAENAALLAVAIQYAWLDLCVESYRATGAAVRDELGQQARTRRLIQRGVSPSIAAQELRIV